MRCLVPAVRSTRNPRVLTPGKQGRSGDANGLLCGKQRPLYLARALSSPRAVGREDRAAPATGQGEGNEHTPSPVTSHPCASNIPGTHRGRAAGYESAGRWRPSLSGRQIERRKRRRGGRRQQSCGALWGGRAVPVFMCGGEAGRYGDETRLGSEQVPVPAASSRGAFRLLPPPVPGGDAPRKTGAPSARTPPPRARAAIISLSANIAALALLIVKRAAKRARGLVATAEHSVVGAGCNGEGLGQCKWVQNY